MDVRSVQQSVNRLCEDRVDFQLNDKVALVLGAGGPNDANKARYAEWAKKSGSTE